MNRYLGLIFIVFVINSCSKKEPAKSVLLDSKWEFSKEALDENCDCRICKNYSK